MSIVLFWTLSRIGPWDHGRVSVELHSGDSENHGIVATRPISDEARRMSDIVNSYLAFIPWDQIKNSWLAIRLSDGGSDGVLYDSKRDAVRHQLDEYRCAYVCYRNCMGGVSPREAEQFLAFNRAAYAAGFRLPDPDDKTGGADTFMPVAQYDRLRGIFRGYSHR